MFRRLSIKYDFSLLTWNDISDQQNTANKYPNRDFLWHFTKCYTFYKKKNTAKIAWKKTKKRIEALPGHEVVF